MAKPRLLFFSDCPVFGGADLVVSNIIGSAEIKDSFEPFAVYRHNARFEEGAKRHFAPHAEMIPVWFPDRIEAVESGSAGFLAKAAWRLADAAIFPMAIRKLRSVFRELRPDVAHINDGGYPGSLGCRAAVVAAKAEGAKVVLAVHNQTRPLTMPGDFLDPYIDRRVSRDADAIVTASKTSQESLVQRLPREKMRLIPDGVTPPPAPRPREDVRRSLGIPNTEICWAMTAFFEERKGHAVLLRAAARTPARVHLVLIGSGAGEAGLKSLATSLGLSGRVHFLGYRPDAHDVVAACDAFVLPSIHSEDMPLSILDAMALGRPVVSTRLANIPEEVDHGVTGLLVDPGDETGLAEALDKLSSDAAMRRAMGEAGAARFEQKFHSRIMAGRYASLYQELLQC